MQRKTKMIILACMVAVLFAVLIAAAALFGWLDGRLKRSEAELRFPYQQLDKREQKLYAALCEGIEEYRETIVLPEVYTKEVYERVYLLAAEQEPQFFYLDEIYETADKIGAVNMFYDTEKDEIRRMTARMNITADRILKLAETKSTDAEKLAVIHDEIARNCKYSDGPHQNDAYGCLVNGKAKCEGYAKAFLYVARRGGMHVMNVTGTIRSGENHVWNIAEIDGAYYNIDVTWDDDDEFKGSVVHCCFAVPDADFSDHNADLSSYQPPACTDTALSWYPAHSLTADDQAAAAGLISNWTGDGRAIEFQCEDESVYRTISRCIQTAPEFRDAVRASTGAAGFQAVADETRRVIIVLPS